MKIFDRFGVTEEQLRALVAEGLRDGGDWCDLYFEDTAYHDLLLRDGVVGSGDGVVVGLGDGVGDGLVVGFADLGMASPEDDMGQIHGELARMRSGLAAASMCK